MSKISIDEETNIAILTDHYRNKLVGLMVKVWGSNNKWNKDTYLRNLNIKNYNNEKIVMVKDVTITKELNPYQGYEGGDQFDMAINVKYIDKHNNEGVATGLMDSLDIEVVE